MTDYTFEGWYTEAKATTPFAFTTKVTKDTTLYAKWTINTYSVTFNVDGGSPVNAIENISHNTSISKPTDPTKEGHTFINQFKDTAKTMAFNFATETITADITLYAKWTRVEYFVHCIQMMVLVVMQHKELIKLVGSMLYLTLLGYIIPSMVGLQKKQEVQR